MSERIFFFMAFVKDKLETFMPNARVIVEPYQKIGVIVEVKWRVAGIIADTSRVITIEEILHGKDVSTGHIEAIKRQVAEKEAKIKNP